MQPSSPLYLDWTFWAALFSLLAIVLSQLPPVHLLVRPKRLEVEVHSRIRIAHMVGNANAGIVVSVRNTGGRTLRIKSISLQISRDGKPLSLLPGLGYFQTPSSEMAVLFVPFSLKPSDTWAHSVIFYNDLDRQTEKIFRKSESALTADIREKLAARTSNDNELVIAEPELVAPFNEIFEQLFIWYPGEYIITLQVKAEPGSASFSKQYRFTLYESDTQDLISLKNDYKSGGGISYKVASHAGVNVPLSEHVS